MKKKLRPWHERKKKSKLMKNKWQPKAMEEFYSFGIAGDVIGQKMCEMFALEKRIEFGNYFKTEKEAVLACKKVRSLLLGLKK